ncbi:TPA: prophage tail fiber N-terminal domain-containing protein [Escherichia albertii]|nr:prophage tail fiber N-terminal domain-containing protein [Escherichia albertii]HEB0994996.1 prophage tail fiber N-terminal domain-containing protein [Escherichia albertii]HEB0999558.1 prophage tail fiber N-terminal domain-containing protein [Escherichia albertii]HEB1004139.1 prophage tail fiber N-terminal domain-containing protein [Escherichia albertii]HEB1008661.1 prophage tail fiber N-terminal domain-containing protein [Escherichia albertii]
MAVKISGVLKDGTGKPVQNCTIQLKARRNSTTVVVNTVASENPDEAGRYSMDVEYGQYSVSLLVEGFPPSHAGIITVYEDSKPGTLNDFLGAMTEDDVRPEALRRFEQMVEEVSRNASAVAQNTAAAKKSASDASASASEAATHATDAAGSARAASTSAGQAASSAQSASSSAGTASTKATEASKSAAAAESSKSAAATSAGAAKTSETNAAASATAAGKSAENALSSATTATAKATEATSQATAAKNSASAAKTSETNAKTSEDNAASSKAAAASSASSAASSASSASASKDEATRQASAAKGSATTASTKATEAAGSATAASQSKTAAESAATRAEAAANRAEEIAGAVAMEDASLTTKGVVKLSSATNSTSESLAATPKAVKAANDNANSRVPSDRKVNGKALTADITLTPKDIGTLNSVTMSFSGGAGWFKLATVTMPQASSIVYIALIGGAGYNVGSPQQAGISELVLRAGNGNPKGITGALWKRTAVGLTNFAWNNTSGDTYDIYVETGNYATSVNIHWDCTANASVSVYTSPTYSASKPSSVTDGVVYTMYSSHQKPTPSDIGALPTTGGTVSGPLSVTGGLTGSLNGNAATATKLQTACTINGVSFDGTANISLSPANIGCPASPTGWLGTGSNGASITTAQLVTILQNNGAFNTKAWVARCAWAYADSASIPDSETGCGIIPLAGAVIEVFSHSATYYTIRITTATTTSVSGALTNAEFIYVFNGTAYSPGWRRALNTKKLPTPLEIGAYSISEVNQMTSNFVTSTKLESGSLDAGFQTLSCYSLQIFDVQTTTDSPNMFVSPIAGYNMVFRSTSSRRYKTDIESLENKYADELLKLRPVWYRSTCERDRKDWGHYGLIAEEVGEIAPQYVHWREAVDDDDPEDISLNGMVAEGVMYDRLVVPLIHHIQKLTKRVEELEARLKLSEL